DALTIFSGLSKCAKYRTIPFAFATFCGLGERSFIVISLIWLYDLLLENIIITCQCGFLISQSGLTSLSCNGLSIQGTCKSSIISYQSSCALSVYLTNVHLCLCNSLSYIFFVII